jgi:hypothetical protein
MSGRAQHLYDRLKSEADRTTFLIGQPEDVNLDAKEWHAKDKKNEKECLESVVDAACGFANASGGVIAVGISAKRDRVNDEDLISALLSFEKPEAVAAKVLGQDALTRTLPFVSSIRLRYADLGWRDFLYMGTVTANGFVELISSDAER